ncbi:MAG: zf-HC2 domain-containing protein [Planctomycetota bacterium]|nr:zf-HC2 domain-containing protein [Planctomycetota bacterium]
MTKPKCEQAAALVPGYLDGELSEEQAAPLRRHLLACPECRTAAQDLTNLRRWFRDPEPVAVPQGFAARVARAAFSGVEPGQPLPEVAPPEPVAPRRDPMPFLLGMTSVAAGLLFAFSLVLGMAQQPAGEQLVAEPLPEILRDLDELNAAETPPSVPLDARGNGARRGDR